MPSTSIRSGNHDRVRRAAFPPDLDLSFGEEAVAKGYLTRERLVECRRHHERLRSRGMSLSMGALLMKRGDLTVEQYLDVLAGRDGGAAPPASRAPEEAPRSVLGRYRIVRELGRGGMGIVYEAHDPVLQRRVALKVLKPQDPPSVRELDRFRREATIGAKLQHPNIVGVHEFGAARDSLGRRVHYLAMDYVEGRTLAQLMAEKATTPQDLLRILEEVGRAVAFAHRRGVVHRDLKPSNVIVEASGRAVLADFGASHADEFETRLTTSGSVIGTPAYMAPEQFQGEPGRIDARADVYALGAILYEALTGQPPFGNEAPPQLLQRILTTDPVPPRRRVATVDPRLEQIALTSMMKDPEKRYPTAREWVEDLARCRSGKPIAARPKVRMKAWRTAGLVVAGMLLAMAASAPVSFEQVPAPASEPGDVRPLYERAVQTARLYGKRVDEIAEEYWRDEVDVGTAADLPRQELARSDARARELQTNLKADLDLIDARVGENPAALGPAEVRCARGLLAWTGGNWTKARELLTEALDESPALQEACEALAMLEQQQRRYDESIRWFSWGHERDRAHLPYVEGRAFARFLRAVALSNGGASAEEEFAAAAADYAAVLEKDRRALVRSGLTHLAWAVQRARSGRDPSDLFAASVRAFDDAVAADLEVTRARLWRGLARSLWGLCAGVVPAWAGSSGSDPRALAAAAIDDFDALIDGPAAPESAGMWRGAAFIVQGILQTTRLADPTSSYERALGDLGEAIRRNPTRDEAWMWRGVARKCWAIREFLGGRDPRAPYESALDDLCEAIRRNPHRADSWTHRGEARLLWAKCAVKARGEDPIPLLDEAIRDLDESIRLNPSQGLVWSYRGTAREFCGRLQAARREGGAEAWYAAALGDYEEAVRLLPGLGLLLSQPIQSCVEVLRPKSP